MSNPTAEEQQKPSDENSTEAPRQQGCRFVVTGFGPFRGVPDNPTSVLARRIREDVAVTVDAARESGGADLDCETHVLETSAEYVRGKIDEIYGLSREDSEESNVRDGDDGANRGGGDEAKRVTTVVLHLGVNYRGKRFHIERCAYDDATFRVPDERGYQPCGERILEGGDGDEDHEDAADTASCELGKRFDTTLDVHTLCREMQKRGEAVVSEDPGRFVCNYTYCLSLDRCKSANMRNGKEHVYHSLFVHVPPFDIISEDKQLDFILKMMQTVEQQVLSG